ncbi:restriction endonuclease subunit S [Lutibacter maritimus]|uniref:Type I restriction enzyme, S subunit n=1 Tax=Lutibacter maritimus TaxID=593133 RepID=A0A1I6REG1_9FLAO|nr:restriction endonuclease subunit S [Lutibacter maritimus]SFS63109.1 type I restriction enzyme, S subunit [Lutibacter maritimus]
MELKQNVALSALKGYKNTVIGVIPEDWVVTRLGDVLKIRHGKSQKEVEVINGKYPILGTGGIMGATNTYLYNKQSVLIGRKGTIDKPRFMDTPFWTVDTLFYSEIFENAIPKYLFYNFLLIDWYSHNEASGVPSLNASKIENIKIPMPSTKEEQKSIAQVLTDTDNLIQTIEQKLSKKRNIKQGAMQQLLTPKKDWEVKKLPDVCWFQEGPGLRNWQFTKNGMKVINVTNLVNGYLNLDKTDRHISMKEFENMYKHFEIDENDIVMASSGNSYSKVAVVRKQDLRLLMNTSVIRFKPINGLDYNYLLIFLKSNTFKDQIDLLITGGAQPNFGPFHLNKIDIFLPPTKNEQTKIATILKDMDNEIEQLEEKLSKYKLLKQGLMQNLLTGKIRLV